MPYHPVVDRITIIPPLDPLWLSIFALIFAVSAICTLRRPAYGAALLAFVTPFAAAHAVFGTTIELPKVVLLGVVVGLTGHRGVTAPLARRPVAAILAAFGAIVVVNVLTLAVAQHRADVVRESFKWIEYALFFGTMVAAYAADPAPRIVRTALFASILVAIASALSELVTSAGSGMWIGNVALPRIAGVLEGPNQLGGYLEVALAAIGAWQLREPSAFGALLLGLAGVALALTFSRAALFGAAVVAIVFAIVNRRAVLRLWPALLGIAAGGVAAVAGITLLLRLSAAGLIEHASDTNAASAGGVGNRAELWRAAFFFIRHHPLLGIGTGNFELDLPEAGLYGVRTHANSWYLQAFAEGGVVLLAATIAWIVATIRALMHDIGASPWRLAAFAATIALVVHGVVDDLVFYPKVAETWIGLIGLGVASNACGRDSS